VSNPCARPRVYQVCEATRFHDSRQMKVVRISAVRNCNIYTPGNIPVTHFPYRLKGTMGHNVAFLTPHMTVRLLLFLVINHFTPNGHFSGRTAPLTSRRCNLYIYSTNIRTEYFKHAAHSPFFPLQNAVNFIMLSFWFLYYSHFIYRVC
jgi:hypothetical protein